MKDVTPTIHLTDDDALFGFAQRQALRTAALLSAEVERQREVIAELEKKLEAKTQELLEYSEAMRAPSERAKQSNKSETE